MPHEKGGDAECGRSDAVKVLGDFRSLDAAVGKSHGRGPPMKVVHPHQSETGRCIGDGLGVPPNAGNHVEKRLDVVADGFKTLHLCRGEVTFIAEGAA